MNSIRSLVKVGNSLYISLPKNWIKSTGLDRGSKVELVIREDNVLEIIPILRRVSSPKRTSIVYDRMFKHRLMASYLAGYEVIEVKVLDGVSPKIIEKINDMLRLLVGVEIVEESEESIVLQCFTRDDYDIVQVLSMMDRITRSMYTSALKCLFDRDIKGLESIIERDDRVDRLYFLSVRLIRSLIRNPMVPSERKVYLMDMRLLARDLEEIGDLSEEIARHAITILKRGQASIPSKDILNISLETATLQSEVMTALLKSSKLKADIFESLESLKHRVRAYIKKLSVTHNLSMFSEIAYLMEDIINRVEDISDLILWF